MFRTVSLTLALAAALVPAAATAGPCLRAEGARSTEVLDSRTLRLTDARGAVGIIQTLGPCLYEGDVAVVRRHTASRVACLRPGDEVAIKEKPWRPEVCVIASITSTSNEDGPMAPIEDHGY